MAFANSGEVKGEDRETSSGEGEELSGYEIVGQGIIGLPFKYSDFKCSKRMPRGMWTECLDERISERTDQPVVLSLILL